MLVRQSFNSVTVLAPAKLNLFLKVLGKRADGFHELETLMVTIGIRDELCFSTNCSTATESADITLNCRNASRRGVGKDVWNLSTGADNLVVKAARLLQTHTGTQQGARIELLKRIPIASGLAGGSSDAAATLIGLNRLWNLNLSLADLHPLAAQLGSDVPFFLSPLPAAICRGRGEIVEPVDLPQGLQFVVARPASGLSTAEVFRHCRGSEDTRSVEELTDCLKAGRVSEVTRRMMNSLQGPAEQLNHDVKKLAEAFARLPVLGHMMSGSGTGYFGVCAQRRQASHVAAQLNAVGIGQVFVAHGCA